MIGGFLAMFISFKLWPQDGRHRYLSPNCMEWVTYCYAN